MGVCFILPLITTNLSIELPGFFFYHCLTCNGDELDTYSSTLATLTHVCQTINSFKNFHFDKHNILEDSIFFFTKKCSCNYFLGKFFIISENKAGQGTMVCTSLSVYVMLNHCAHSLFTMVFAKCNVNQGFFNDNLGHVFTCSDISFA